MTTDEFVTAVLRQQTTFADEVTRFYDMDTWMARAPRFGSFRVHKPRAENLSKRGSAPTELADILEGFSEQALNTQKPAYDEVRADYQRLRNPWRTARREGMVFGGVITTLAGMAGITGVFGGNLPGYMAPIAAAAIVGGGWLFAFRAHNQPLPKGSNDEYGEYLKLYESAERADKFVERTYRQKLIDTKVS